ncbi:hypothetical protein PPACK8108_LOCUS3043 [Phakopsora pachyrhizi]|uniref:Uncharacterized protein n=1 Tax=Phakopsora pachyrhizi TaxID=170000 RepID=A0AAV0ALX1_PHAPC|nr:hypothetical protein PPACK8108_LOCUS3043 [Phakopsora pachyrhizi]
MRTRDLIAISNMVLRTTEVFDQKMIEIDQEIHTGPGLRTPPVKGRRARGKAGKEQHSKSTECHESAIQAQGKYEKE